jgi:hypothetical protein
VCETLCPIPRIIKAKQNKAKQKQTQKQKKPKPICLLPEFVLYNYKESEGKKVKRYTILMLIKRWLESTINIKLNFRAGNII